MFGWMIFAARIVLGTFYLLSGANWFFGFIPFLPHIGMPGDMPIKHEVVAGMIQTGWMFQSAKVLEVAFGLSLLAGRAVPLMLAATLPVAFITFMLDALVLDDLFRWLTGEQSGAALSAALWDMAIGGLCTFLPHIWLIWCFFAYFRPSVAWKAQPEVAWIGGSAGTVAKPAAPAAPWLRSIFFAFGWLAIALQSYNLYLFLGLISL